MSTDYYQILGLHPSADDELIDKAYRLLARRYHPDQQPGQSEVMRFKQIQEAYEVLSSPQLRAQYDQGVLEVGQAMRVGVGADVIQMLRLRFDQAARGGRVTMNRLSGQQIRQIDVNIPRAVDDGARLRLRGQGMPASAGGPAGDLILIVSIEPHRQFRRDGLDLFVDIDIPVDVAMLGGRVPVPTLESEAEVEIPPGTSGGTKLRVRAAGLRNDANQYGDLYAVVRVKIPRSVSRRAQEIAASPEDEARAAEAIEAGEPASPSPVAEESAEDLEARRARLDRLAGRLNMRMRRLSNYRAALRQRLQRLDYELRSGGRQRDLLDQHAMLVMVDTEQERRTFPLSKPVTVIGRRAGCDLSIPLTSVSREHAQIEYRDGSLIVRDLGSANGIEHNGRRVEQAELAAGDVVTIGPVNLQLRIDGEPAGVDPPPSQIPEDAGPISYSAAAIAAFHEHQAYRREQQQVHHAAEQLQQSRSKLEDQQRRMNEHQAQLERDREQIDGDREALNGQVESAGRRREELDRRQRQLDEAEQALEQSRQAVEADREALSIQQKKLETARVEFETLHAKLREEHTQHEGDATDVRGEREQIQKQQVELAEQRASLEAEQQRLHAEKQTLEADRESAATQSQQLDADRAQIQADREVLATQSQQLQQQAEALAARQETVDRQQRQLEQKQREVSEQTERLEADRAALDRRETELTDRERRLAEKLDKLPEHVQRVDQQRQMIDSLQQQLAERQAEVDGYLERLSTRHQQSESEQAKLELLRKQVEAENEALTRRREQLQRDEAACAQQSEQLEASRRAVEDERQKTLAGLLEHQKQLEACEAELDARADELDRRRSELELVEEAEAAVASEPEDGSTDPEPREHEAVSLGSVMTPQAAVDDDEAAAADAAPKTHLAIKRVDLQPVFDLTPNHVRSAAGYRDRSGDWHLLVDYVDASQKTTNTWGAEIRYYRNRSSKTWDWVQTAVGRGSFDDGDADCFGAASPALVHVGSRVLMFYAGRGGVRYGDDPKILAPRGEAGHLSSCIMLAVAEADPSGAITGPFRKQGVVVDLGDGWDALRLDHPAVVLDHQTLHLFYTGYDDARRLDHRQLGYAAANVNDLKFTRRDQPILEVRGGAQVPRVFRHEGRWHLLYHHNARNDGARWRHYVASELPDFELADPNFFDGVGGESNPLMVWTDPSGRLAEGRDAWVTSAAGGCWRMFPYRIDTS